MKRVFFITGLPRSRTAWLANLFTYGPSFCWHDLLAQAPVADWPALFDSVPQPIVGVSDSGLPLRADALRAAFPQAKWILVRRPLLEALDSFLQFVQAEPYAGLPAVQSYDARLLFGRLDAALDSLMASLGRDDMRTVDFAALEWMETARALWQFVCPFHPFHGARWEQLHRLRVETIPAKVPIQPQLVAS